MATVGKTLRKKITTMSEYLSSLSYITDVSTMHDDFMSDTQRFKYSRTLAYGNGSGYVYPKAMFLGSPNNQVYPPVIDCTLTNIRFGIGLTPTQGHAATTPTPNQKILTMSLDHRLGEITPHDISSGIPYTYVFPNVFSIKYSRSGNASPSSYSTVTLPNFQPGVSNKFAYVSGYTLTIGNGTTSYPFFGAYTYFPEYGVSLTTEYGTDVRQYLLTHLEVSPNSNVVDNLFTTYDVKNLLAYNSFSSAPKVVLRRSFNIGTNMQITSKWLGHYNRASIFSAGSTAPLEIAVNHTYTKMTDFDPKWKFTYSGSNLICTNDTNISQCLEMPGFLINAFLVDMTNFTMTDANFKNIRVTQCGWSSGTNYGNSTSHPIGEYKIFTNITKDEIIRKNLQVNLRFDETHGDTFNHTLIYPNWNTDEQFIKIFSEKNAALYNLPVASKAREDQYKPDLKVLFKDIISLVYASDGSETLTCTKANYLGSTNLFSFDNYTLNGSDIQLSINYPSVQSPNAQTIYANATSGSITCTLAANIIVPFYYTKNGVDGYYLGFAKGMVMSNENLSFSSRGIRPSDFPNYQTSYVIYFE